MKSSRAAVRKNEEGACVAGQRPGSRLAAVAISVLAWVCACGTVMGQNAGNGQTPAVPNGVYPVQLHHGVPKDDRGESRRIRNGSPIVSGPAGAHLTYYGGPVVSSIKVAVVYWGSGSYLPQLVSGLPGFFSAITNGNYMDMLSEYSTQGVSGGGTTGNELIERGGSGAFLGSFTITPSVTGTTISDSQIQTELQAQINSAHLPAPDYDANGNADTLYMVYFPPGVTITQGGSSSCVSGGFCAYHGTIATSSSRNILYGVQPDMQQGSGCFTGCGNSTVFNNYTAVASHEFSETITDAAVGLATTTAPPLAWYDNTNGEVGDICNGIQGTADGYTVQAEWSNLQNGCAVGPVTFTVTTPASVSSGSAFNVTVQTKDSAGNNLSGYRGTIAFSSTDGSATLPANYTFTATDAGAHTFSGVILRTTGSQTISATGTVNVGFRGTSAGISVGSASANDFSISASPSSVSVAQGASGSSTISTAVVSGSASTVSLSVSGAPSGVTASLSPTSVTAGGSSTLTMTVASTATAGTYTLTITGTEGTVSHTATVALTVTSSGGGGSGGITNGGFESGLTGWTTSGASVSAVTSGCHSGSGCARAGSTSPTNGDSSLAQTFTAPSNATGISLWYKMSCPDTVTYDWATVTLRDNTSATSVTLLPKTCTTNAWTNVTGSLTASHSYTITLTSHDDNYSADPSYTLYDDVTIITGTVQTGIVNGGFETGTSSGWTIAGASEAIVASGCHSGSYCGRAGNTTPTNGDSSFSQTFVVPAGKSQLSVWYKMTCPDTVTYDWATITLKNNSTGTTATVLGKVCTTNSWTNVTAAVSAGTSYTITLTSHDDNYSADPTYTLFDDAALN
ncbi:hypothetical protein DYQ86_08455 [Acidobacteria bacterium AB60]|nr:hypothetical protein DYQ86_08455 [Acidobacteria bacterium AB60]